MNQQTKVDGSKSCKDDLSRLAIHTMTTKPLSLSNAIREYRDRGVTGISVWKEALEGIGVEEAKRMLDDAGMFVPALVRGGFFCDPSPNERQLRIDENRRLLETSAALSADMLVLVVGATVGVPLERQRGWVREGVQAMLPEAEELGVKIAIEPLHPMYAADKSCINRLAEARRLCEEIDHSSLGVAVDVYHTWWDPDLMTEIELLGASKRIFGFHVCDWRVPTRHLLTDRALMGDGCINLREIRMAVEAAGFSGWCEVEIFSDEHWARDQSEFIDDIIHRFALHC